MTTTLTPDYGTTTVRRDATCRHDEIGDSIALDRALRETTRANYDEPSLFCGACRSYLYPYLDITTDEIVLSDEPRGAGA